MNGQAVNALVASLWVRVGVVSLIPFHVIHTRPCDARLRCSNIQIKSQSTRNSHFTHRQLAGGNRATSIPFFGFLHERDINAWLLFVERPILELMHGNLARLAYGASS